MLLFEQWDRHIATNKFIYTGNYKKEKGDCKQILSQIGHQLAITMELLFCDQEVLSLLVQVLTLWSTALN